MPEISSYPTDRIRNVALVGHQGAGKTMLAEALCHVSGAIPRLGRIEDGSTLLDFAPDEQRRGHSVALAMAPVEWSGCKLNVVDTPGYADFAGHVHAALAVADLAVVVVSGADGLGIQAELAWRAAAERGLPRMVFVNQLDRDRASFRRTLDELKGAFGAGIAPIQLPIGEGDSLAGVVNLLADVSFTYPDGGPVATEGPVPDAMADEEQAVHEELVEGIVVGDDDLMERYLADDELSLAELKAALAGGIAAGSVFPVLCGSATGLVGVDRLATFLVEEAPPPEPRPGPTAVTVFGTMVDPYVGRLSLFRVQSGEVHPDDHLRNRRTGNDERFHHLVTLRGKEQLGMATVPAGDIAAVGKLDDTVTGDALAARDHEEAVPTVTRPAPVHAIAIRARDHADEDKLAHALHRLLSEDPTLDLVRDAETHQTLLRGLGDLQLTIAIERLQDRFGVAVDTEDVRVAYRETVTTGAEAEGKHKKQTGGAGQFGVASLRVEPLPPGSGIEFVDAVVGGAIPRSFIPAVEKGVREAAAQGGVFGFPVVDVRVTVFDGKHHPVDSKEVAFKMAGSLAFRSAIAAAHPIVLEPVSRLVAFVDEAHLGDVMGDLNARRGRIIGTAAGTNGEIEVDAEVPTAEVLRYAVDLRALTSGRGRFTVEPARYEPVPANLVERVTGRGAVAAAAT